MNELNRLGSFISRTDLGFTRTVTNGFLFLTSSLRKRTLHPKDDMTYEGFHLFDVGGFTFFGVTGILGSPICISVYAAISGEFNVG
jgi:hypothetical protein